MRTHFFRGVVVAGMLALAVSGCATVPEQQAFNRDAHAGMEHIAVLPTRATETNVLMLNHPGVSFGLIGGLVAASDQASKEKKFRATMNEAGFDPLDHFRERLAHHMAIRGYTLVWADGLVESKKAPRESTGLRKTYAAVPEADAQLDLGFTFIGYAAAGATDASPYRPTVSLNARLASADGSQNLYTDQIIHNNVFNQARAVTIEADPKYSYPGFDDLHIAGAEAVEGLRQAIDAVAAKLANQL